MELRDGIKGWNGLLPQFREKAQMRGTGPSAQITTLILLLDIGTYEL